VTVKFVFHLKKSKSIRLVDYKLGLYNLEARLTLETFTAMKIHVVVF